MEFYGQEAEAELLAAFLPRLQHRSVVDVGAERGAFAEAMLNAGSDEVHVIEPEPANVTALRERFDGDDRVVVHDCAISDMDGELTLHTSVGPAGEPISFGHTVLDVPDTDEIAWRETVTVGARSLASLVEDGVLARQIGILKIDTEGHDLAVVAGMGELDPDVVMTEHWTDLPHSLGPCPWSAEQMIASLRSRGFSHFVFIAHLGEFVTLKWDDASIAPSHMGNLVFLHDRVLDSLVPDVLVRASELAQNTVAIAEERIRAAEQRLVVIEALTRERDLYAKAAQERLDALEELDREHEFLANTAEERLAALEQVTRERDTQAKAATDRLEAIDELQHERGLLAKAADERLNTIEQLTRERDLQAKAADERLAMIDALTTAHTVTIAELTHERDLQAKAAEERLEAMEELKRERDVHAGAAQERLETMEGIGRERKLRSGSPPDGWR